MTRNFICVVLMVGMALDFLVIFSRMWFKGELVASEPNLYVRGFELALFLGAFCFGLWYFVRELVSKYPRK